MHRLQQHHVSFKNAWNGVKWAFTTQPNFQIHLIISVMAVAMGLILQISQVEMALIVITITFGLGVEMLNTSIESMTDMITSEWRQEAKIAKDVAAGMMLLFALGAITEASIIFLPRIWMIFA
jgi:diacylglycerol kinase (ATP)